MRVLIACSFKRFEVLLLNNAFYMLIRFSNKKVICTANREWEIELKNNTVVSFYSLHLDSHHGFLPRFYFKFTI